MPLFVYKCEKCGEEIEKFQHNAEPIEVLCKECGEKCERQFPETRNRVQLNARDTYEQKIKPEVDRICKDIAAGKDRAFLDICGEK